VIRRRLLESFRFQQLLEQHGEASLRFFPADARLQPAEECRKGAAAVIEIVARRECGQRHPRVGGVADDLADEPPRRDADDFRAHAPDENRPPHDRRVTTELPLPETVAQHDHRPRG
jgi:hypothetical protein